jgi:hypothetical protein
MKDILKAQTVNKKLDSYFKVINHKGCTYSDTK